MTEQTFKVGDKATHRYHGTVEVTYGPYKDSMGETLYMMRFSGEAEQAVSPSMLTPLPAFAVGDVVTLSTTGSRATVEYGPFDDRDVYLVKLVEPPADVDGAWTFTALAHIMTKVVEPEPVKVGDRVKVLVADPGNSLSVRFVDRVGVLDRVGAGRTSTPYLVKFGDGPHGAADGTWYCDSVEKVGDETSADTFEYDGVTYEYGVRYTDNDGDPWTFKRSTVHGQPVSDNSSCFIGDSIASAVRDYGPLTKHTA